MHLEEKELLNRKISQELAINLYESVLAQIQDKRSSPTSSQLSQLLEILDLAGKHLKLYADEAVHRAASGSW
jgi:hypothetical protein